MRIWLNVLSVALALLMSNAAAAAVVVASKANCRAEASERAPIVGTLPRGAEVGVVTSRNGWSEVNPPALRMCWVRSDFIAAPDSVAAIRARQTSSSARVRSAPSSRRSFASSRSSYRSKAAPSRRRSSGGSSLQGGSCPCGGSNVCVGPRGGRYCMTSGGNKRYGV